MNTEAESHLDVTAGALLKALAERGWRFGTAESLTGGMVGAAVTAVPGASRCYVGGIISYADRAKVLLLGVGEDVLSKHGAVSAEVAEAMAEGCRARLQVDVAIATTGIAGPASDERGTPVGTVFVAVVTPDARRVERLMLAGSRQEIRVAATHAALRLALRLVEMTSELEVRR
ncbi:MAG: CinA family protein [Candidatus Cryosericum sp.]